MARFGLTTSFLTPQCISSTALRTPKCALRGIGLPAACRERRPRTMVLWKYEQGSEVCYYDDEEQDCTWNLPTDLDYEPEPADLTNALTKKKVERAFQRSISKRATALRVGLDNYERKKYAEARRNFALAKRYGLNDEDIHYKDVHACTMVWQADPTTEGLESCRKAFEWLLQSVPSSQTPETVFELVKVYTCAGSYHLALELLTIMEAAFPSSPVSRDGHMLAATIYAYVGASMEALQLFDLLTEPPDNVRKQTVSLLMAWLELGKGEELRCVGHCEEGLRHYILYLYEIDDPSKSRTGYNGPLDWFKDARVWRSAGDMALTGGRSRNYLLAALCFREAIRHGDRSEAAYLQLFDCHRHLSMLDEGVAWLSHGHMENPMSLAIRDRLGDFSEEWAEEFGKEDEAAVALQSIVRMYLGMMARRARVQEREFQRRQAELEAQSVKWAMRRLYCEYFDRRKSKRKRFKVTKRDFFDAWRSALPEFRDERQRSATLIQSLFRMLHSRTLVERRWKYNMWLDFVESEVLRASRRYRAKRACAALRRVMWLLSLRPAVLKVQCAYRCHLARLQLRRRRNVATLIKRHCAGLASMILETWHTWARDNRRDRMSVRLQSAARMWAAQKRRRRLVAKRMRQQEAMARVVSQAAYRAFLARWYNRAQDLIERQHACAIQHVARAYIARQIVSRRRRAVAGVAFMIERRRVWTLRRCFVGIHDVWMDHRFHNFAVVMQCAMRCYLARRAMERRIDEIELKRRRAEEKERAKMRPVTRRVLGAWKLYTRHIRRRKHAAALVIQRLVRGRRGRKKAAVARYWWRRGRLRDKNAPRLEAKAKAKGAKVYTRLAVKMWRRAFFVSRRATVIQAAFRGYSDRLYVNVLKARREKQRAFAKKCMALHDKNAPAPVFAHWWAFVVTSRMAMRLQRVWMGHLARLEARRLREVRRAAFAKLLKIVKRNDLAWAKAGLARWKRFHVATCKATIIQAHYRGHRTYMHAKRRHGVAMAIAQACMRQGIVKARRKMAANVVLQSAFRREKAYRRCRALAEHLYIVEEERAAMVKGRALHRALQLRFAGWRRETEEHRRKVIIAQAWFRTWLASRVVGRRRHRAAEIEKARLAMAAKRGGRWVKRCFKAIEGQLVTAAVARLEMVISIKTDPASNEVMCLADKLRRPTAAPDVQRHGGGHSNQSDSLDLLPFIPDPDGKMPLDLYPKDFVTARYQIREFGVLEWKRCQHLSFREKVALLLTCPTVVVERCPMGDMVDGLRCIAAHRQRSRLAKIVCTSTTLPPDLDDLLAYLRESTDLRGLCLTDVPVSLSQARALAGLLIEAKLEELILDSNGLSNASLAVICRAAQVQMSLTRLGIRNNTLDQAQAGHEMGDLLCNSGYLKTLSLSRCRMDGSTLLSLCRRALCEPSTQCRLHSLDLSGNHHLPQDTVCDMFVWLGTLGGSLAKSGIAFIDSLDLSACGLTDVVVPPLLDFLRTRAGSGGKNNPTTTLNERFKIHLDSNQLSETGARALLIAADELDVEVNLLGNDSLSLDFIKHAAFGPGRSVTKHLEKVIVADMLVQRPQSPFNKYYRAPPLLWA